LSEEKYLKDAIRAVQQMRARHLREIEKLLKFLEAISDQLKVKATVQSTDLGEAGPFRKGSEALRVYNLLRAEGRPMHIADIIDALELSNTRAGRMGLVTMLSRYAREGREFFAHGNGVYGLIESDLQ
jgi:hypothetical protein